MILFWFSGKKKQNKTKNKNNQTNLSYKTKILQFAEHFLPKFLLKSCKISHFLLKSFDFD